MSAGDPQGFVPGNELEATMGAAARDPALEPRFMQALRDAQLYMPSTDEGPPEEQEVHLQEGDELELPVLEHGGQQYVPVYSSQDQLLRARPEGSAYRRVEGRTLATILPPDLGLAINPGGDVGVALESDQVRELRDGPARGPAVIPAGAEIMVGAPAEERPEVLEAVTRFAREHPAVRSAYRALVWVKEPGERPRYVVGLEVDPDVDADPLLRSAVAAAAAAGGELPELVPVDRDNPTGITRWMLEKSEPFYRS